MSRLEMTDQGELARRPRRWPIFAPLVLVIVLAVAWSLFWVFAARTARQEVEDWRAQQAKAGRVFTCADEAFGGYPFRIEVRCSGAGAELKDTQPPLTLQLKEILVVAQVWDPKLIIVEFGGPLTASDAQGAPYTVGWTLAQASLRGTPEAPERASIAIDGLTLDRDGKRLMQAQHAEFHARMQFGSWPHNPAVDLAVKLVTASAPAFGPLVGQPTDLDATGVLYGLRDLRPKPLPVWLRDWQAAGGRIDIQTARLAQGDARATAAGALGLSPRGALDGALQVTVAGLIERLLPALGREQPAAKSALGMIERAVPSVSGTIKGAPGQPNPLQNSLLALIGQPTELEGKPAVTVPLKFTDGAASLGPIGVGSVPPLY